MRLLFDQEQSFTFGAHWPAFDVGGPGMWVFNRVGAGLVLNRFSGPL